MSIQEFLAKLKNVKKTTNGWQALCPAHDDQKPSLSTTESPDGKILLHCKAGCKTESVVAKLGLTMADLFAPRTTTRKFNGAFVEAYNYNDKCGRLLFQTVRFDPKDFRQRRPDPKKPSKWIWDLKGVQRVLYRLPELLAAIADRKTIFVAAGEKDVNALVQHGFEATCNPMGEKKDGKSWLRDYTETFRDATSLVVIADKDDTGRGHARAVATALHSVVRSVKLLELPDCGAAKVKDTFDWFAAGGTADELRAIVEQAPVFDPAQIATPESESSEDPEAAEESDQDQPAPAKESMATKLVKLAEHLDFFHDPKRNAYVRLDVGGHVEVWPVRSSQFEDKLRRTFYLRTRKAITRNSLADAVAILAAKACYESPEAPVYLRVAPHGEKILIDLCDEKWRVIEVTAGGWNILDRSPIAFIRTGAMRPMPMPAPAAEGSLDPLWQMLNVTPAQRPLFAGAVLNGFQPDGPYFVINLVGEQGSAKSCAARILRMIIDPNEVPLRSPPREERDLLVDAANNRCVVLDNLSGLPPWLSDGVCRLSTGGGHSARQLYSDCDEFTIAVKRPVILTGIDDVATRPDLAERALQIELEMIPDGRRMTEKELWRRFEAALPIILSGILNALVCALRELPNVPMDSLPRMADAALFASAGETACGFECGTFMAAYWANINEGAVASLDAHPVGIVLRQFLDDKQSWRGEAAELLEALNGKATEQQRSSRGWPGTPRKLRSCLQRLAQALRRAGFDLTFSRGKRRIVELCKRCSIPSEPSLPSAAGGSGDCADGADGIKQPLHVFDGSELPLQHGVAPIDPAKLVEEVV